MADNLGSLLGVIIGSVITIMGSYFSPLLQENRKQKKREKDNEPRKQRLLLMLKEQIDSNSQKYYPQYEIGQLCAAVGLSEPDCKELLVKIGAWGGKIQNGLTRNNEVIYNEYWSLNPAAFYPIN